MNSGTSGPLPAPVSQRMQCLLAHEALEGPATPPLLAAGMAEIVAAKNALARFLGAQVEELALTQNATQGLTLVAAGYPWDAGDEVLTTDQEHVSGLVPWYGLARDEGVRVRVLPIDPDPDVTVRAFAEALTPATRVIAFSHVSYCTGMRLPAERLCALARDAGVLSAIDGAQAAGQIPLDLHALGVDFYALPGQKWMMGPDGTGAFYVRAGSLERLRPPALGWASVAWHDWGGNYTLFPSARRFETATVNIPTVGGFRAAVELLLEIGIEKMAARIAMLASLMKERLAALPGVTVISPPEPERSSGLVSCALSGVEAEVTAQRLWNEERILCRSIPRPYSLRFSTHAFNTEDEIEAAVAAVARITAGQGPRGACPKRPLRRYGGHGEQRRARRGLRRGARRECGRKSPLSAEPRRGEGGSGEVSLPPTKYLSRGL